VLSLMSKWEGKNKIMETDGMHEDRGIMSVFINAKGGYCWKVGCN